MKAITSAIATGATLLFIIIGTANGAAAQPDHYNLNQKINACENISLPCLISVLSPEKPEKETMTGTRADISESVNHRFN